MRVPATALRRDTSDGISVIAWKASRSDSRRRRELRRSCSFQRAARGHQALATKLRRSKNPHPRQAVHRARWLRWLADALFQPRDYTASRATDFGDIGRRRDLATAARRRSEPIGVQRTTSHTTADKSLSRRREGQSPPAITSVVRVSRRTRINQDTSTPVSNIAGEAPRPPYEAECDGKLRLDSIEAHFLYQSSRPALPICLGNMSPSGSKCRVRSNARIAPLPRCGVC